MECRGITKNPQVWSIISTTNYLDILSSILDQPQFEVSVILSTVDLNCILPWVQSYRPSISTVFFRECNPIDRRYRLWPIDRSINPWISIDIWMCVGTITQTQWDHGLLGGCVSKTIFHHLWDHRSMSFLECDSYRCRGVKTSYRRCMRTWQSPYEIIGDDRNEGGHRYQPLDRFILRQLLPDQRRQSGLWTRSPAGRDSRCWEILRNNL